MNLRAACTIAFLFASALAVPAHADDGLFDQEVDESGAFTLIEPSLGGTFGTALPFSDRSPATDPWAGGSMGLRITSRFFDGLYLDADMTGIAASLLLVGGGPAALLAYPETLSATPDTARALPVFALKSGAVFGEEATGTGGFLSLTFSEAVLTRGSLSQGTNSADTVLSGDPYLGLGGGLLQTVGLGTGQLICTVGLEILVRSSTENIGFSGVGGHAEARFIQPLLPRLLSATGTLGVDGRYFRQVPDRSGGDDVLFVNTVARVGLGLHLDILVDALASVLDD